MQRCLSLAAKGLGGTYPNPMVGAVIVHNNKIIGEGWHKKAGAPHAEVNAINSVQNPELLAEATLYVSLEPCSHFGKTPPCADLVIAKGIKKVVVGCSDPNPKVAGNGIAKLITAGCTVLLGVLEEECKALNKRFFCFHKNRRPFIILKWAESRDGYIAPLKKSRQAPVWLSGKTSRQLVHKWRTQEQAILVGANTALADNPKLTARDWNGPSPLRVVIDLNNRLPKSLSVFNSDAPSLLVTKATPAEIPPHIQILVIDKDKEVLPQLLDYLVVLNIQSLIVEGGTDTINQFIAQGLWDEARVFKAPVSLNKGIVAPKITVPAVRIETIDKDILTCYNNTNAL